MISPCARAILSLGLLTAAAIASAAPSREDRVRGSFLGLAFGEARGRATEGLRPRQIENLRANLPLGKKQLARLPRTGLAGDATAQAMALQLALQYHPRGGEASRRAFARLLGDGYAQRSTHGLDQKSAQALKRLRRGVDPIRSGSRAAGLAPAARSGVLAGLESIHSAVLAHDSVRASVFVTHADHRAFLLAQTVNAVNASLLRGLDADRVLRAVPALVRALEPDWLASHADRVLIEGAEEFLRALETVFARLPGAASPSEISRLVVEVAGFSGDGSGRPLDPNADAPILGGLHALALALGSVDPLETLEHVARLGGASDLVGAIAGSILGARFGTAWIPLAALGDRVRLESYAGAMTSGVPPETAAEYLARELDLATVERVHRRSLVDCAVRLQD